MQQSTGATTASRSITDTISQAPMSGLQIMAIAICVLINALDGFDILTMAFTAAHISKEWELDPSELGVLFSAGLAGMAVGSVLLAPAADKIGRRAIVLGSLLIIGVGMLTSAASQDVTQLAALRFVTGLGIGCVLPSLNAIVAEYASGKRRDFAISIMTIGYSAGAVLGGVIAVYLITRFGWRSVFVAGGAATLLVLPLVYFKLPESVSFLVARKPRGALEKVNRTLLRMGHAPVARLHEDGRSKSGEGARAADIFGPALLRSTLLTCACYFLIMCSFYVLLSWTPKFLVELGMSASGGISGSVLMNLMGIPGGLLLGWLSARYGLTSMSVVYLVLCFAAVALFSIVPADTALLLGLTAVIGFLMNGAVVSLYALGPRSFPAGVRATGIGIALGAGRLGGALGPYVVGLIMAAGVSATQSFVLMTLPMLIAACLFPLAARRRADGA